MCSARAMPIPGNATCDSASPASAMRRITAKHPMSPAASAIVDDSARASMLMDVKGNGRSVDLVQQIRREDGPGFSEMCGAAAQTQYVGRVLMGNGQIVGNQENGEPPFRLQPLDDFIQPFLSWFIDARRRLVEQQHIGIAHQRKRDQQALKLSS